VNVKGKVLRLVDLLYAAYTEYKAEAALKGNKSVTLSFIELFTDLFFFHCNISTSSFRFKKFFDN